jgi:hypothetical protein
MSEADAAGGDVVKSRSGRFQDLPPTPGKATDGLKAMHRNGIILA